MDTAATHVQVQEVTRFDLRGQPVKKTTVSYFLGSNGPFTDEFDLGSDTADAINAKMAERAARLRAIGALPPVTY